MPRKLRLVPIALVVAIAAAGCGSSNTNTGNATTSTTAGGTNISHTAAAKHLVAAADPICKKVAKKREAANASLHGTSKTTLEVLARLAPEVGAYEHQAVAKLRKIAAPSTLAHDWQQMLSGLQQLADYTSQLGTQAKAKDLKKVESLTSIGRELRAKLTTVAERDGFTYCGRTS